MGRVGPVDQVGQEAWGSGGPGGQVGPVDQVGLGVRSGGSGLLTASQDAESDPRSQFSFI